MFTFKNIDFNGIHTTVTFLDMSISTCPGNSAFKMQVTGSGSGFLNRASMRNFPDVGGLYVLRPPLRLVLGQTLICRKL